MTENDTKFNQGLENLEKMFTSKTVVGDPIQVDGHTIVPLLAVGLGFGAGSGSGGDNRGKGEGGGFGGGGGVRPVALIISGKDGVRVERLVGATASTLEGLAGVIGKMRSGQGPAKNAG
ncbi:MAG: spore germination protein GerW family protein [Solirubrobacterales bacterium]